MGTVMCLKMPYHFDAIVPHCYLRKIVGKVPSFLRDDSLSLELAKQLWLRKGLDDQIDASRFVALEPWQHLLRNHLHGRIRIVLDHLIC